MKLETLKVFTFDKKLKALGAYKCSHITDRFVKRKFNNKIRSYGYGSSSPNSEEFSNTFIFHNRVYETNSVFNDNIREIKLSL